MKHKMQCNETVIYNTQSYKHCSMQQNESFNVIKCSALMQFPKRISFFFTESIDFIQARRKVNFNEEIYIVQ